MSEEKIADLQRQIDELKARLDPPKPTKGVSRAPYDPTENFRFTAEQLGLDPKLGPDLGARDPSLSLGMGSSPQSPPQARGSGWVSPRKLDHPLDSFAGRMVDADLARRK